MRTVSVPDERGLALLVVLMAMALLLALGSALVLTAMTETRVWMRHRDAAAALHAAEAALARALVALAAHPDWVSLLAGVDDAGVTDGPPAGVRPLPRGGGTVDLTSRTHVVRCGRPDGCAEEPGQWRLYAWGPLEAFVPAAGGGLSMYVMVWISGDPAETDHERSAIRVLGHAYGPGGVHRSIRIRISRVGTELRIESWTDAT